MVKMICWDMDGTLAQLYGVPNWLELLRAYDTTPYEIAEPMWNMAELAKTLINLKAKGIEIRIITWLSKDTTAEYDQAVRLAKLEWLKRYDFPFDHFHGVKYGTTKANCVRAYLQVDETAILIDDNATVRKGWTLGDTIDPTNCDVIELLKKL